MIPAPMRLPRFDFEAPETLPEACELLAQADKDARLMAGGTDLLLKMKRGALSPRVIISLGKLDSLTRLTPLKDSPKDGLRIGSCLSMSRIASHALLLASYQALAEGAAWVGGPIIRNRATIGGNIVNARPCADTLPPLIALHARLQLQSTQGQRSVPIEGFITAPGQCLIQPSEILTAIELPAPLPNSGSHYIKITRRAAMEVTIVGCAASITLDPTKQRVIQARLVYTSVAPIPLRIPRAEAIIEGQVPTMELLENVAREAQQRAPTIGDHRAPQSYRSELVAVTTRRTLKAAIERAGGRVH